MSLCLTLAAAMAAVNLFCNPDYSEDDGVGGPCAWTLYHDGVQTVRAKALGDGEWELVAVEPKLGYFRQAPVTLVPGARYRFSAKVKCDLPEGAVFMLDVQNHWWGKSIRVKAPRTTGGEWKEIAWEGAMIDSRKTDDYSIGFAMKAGPTGSASVRLRDVKLEPLDEAAVKGSKPLDPRNLAKIPARIVPVEPLLTRVDPANAAFTCYWPGPAGCVLRGELSGGRRQAKFGEDGRATLVFGKVGFRKARLRLQAVDAEGRVLREDSYPVLTEKPENLKGPEGRRLNNLVTELHNGPLANGRTRFFRKTDGFVWISFSAADGGRERTARGYLDGSAVAAVRFDPDERYTEAMRFVKGGWHELEVREAAAGSRLRIHAVPRLGMSLWGVRLPEGGPCSMSENLHVFTMPFMRRYRLPASNFATACGHRFDDPANPTARCLASRGWTLFGGVQYRPEWTVDHALAREKFRDGMWAKGWGVDVDELCIHEPRTHHAAIADVLWEMFDECPDRQVDLFFGDADKFAFDDEKVHASLLAAMANSGRGNGILLPELYAEATKEIAGVDASIDHYADVKLSAERMVPAMKGKFYLHMSPYTGLGHWTSGTYPEVDLKHQYAYLMYRLATDPRFADAGGLGGGPTSYCEEELIRWTGRCFRYYGIEGGADNLAEKLGYARLPGFAKNVDFDHGLEGWTVEGGDVKPRNVPRLGKGFEARVKARGKEGDNVAEFTTVEGVPSRLSQTLTGLKPGEYYTVMFVHGNSDSLEKPSREKPPRAMTARLEGCACVKDLTFHYRIRRPLRLFRAPEGSVGYLNTYRYVFKASSASAKLVFEDRDDEGRAAPAGTRQFLNYVVVRPFYHEDEADIAEIIRVLTRGD